MVDSYNGAGVISKGPNIIPRVPNISNLYKKGINNIPNKISEISDNFYKIWSDVVSEIASHPKYYLKVGGVFVAGGALTAILMGCNFSPDIPIEEINTQPSMIVEAPKDGAHYSASFATNNQLKFPFKAIITDKEGGEIILEVYNETNVNNLGCNPPIIRKELYLDPDSVFNFEEDTGLAGELKAGKTYHMRATLIDGELSPVVKDLIYHIKQLQQEQEEEEEENPPIPPFFKEFMLKVYHIDITENYEKLNKFFPGKGIDDFREEYEQWIKNKSKSKETSMKTNSLDQKVESMAWVLGQQEGRNFNPWARA